MAKKRITHKTNTSLKALKSAIHPYNDHCHVAEQIEKLNQFSTSINARRKELEESLSVEDRSISDLEHYLEFSDGLDMYKSWLVMKNLQNRLRKRRDIKREKTVLDAILANTPSTKNVDKIVKNNQKYEENRGYIPRELPCLFES